MPHPGMSRYNETVFNSVTINPKLQIINMYKGIFIDVEVTTARTPFLHWSYT